MDRLVSLKVFRGVVETGSFAGAANRENLSPAMASRHIMHLERSLRARLLNRTTRQISLTEAGEIFYKHCRGMLELLEEAEAQLADIGANPAGTLKLAAPSWFGGQWFAEMVVGFHRDFPQVLLDITFTDRPVNIVEEAYDLAISVTFAPPEAFIAKRLGSMPYRLVAAPTYLARQGEPQTPEDLAQHAFITTASCGKTPPGLIEFQRDGRLHQVRLRPTLRLNDPTVAREAVKAGMGFSILPAFLSRRDMACGSLKPILGDYTLPEPSLYAIYASRRQLSPKVRAFIDYFVARHTDDDPRHGDTLQSPAYPGAAGRPLPVRATVPVGQA